MTRALRLMLVLLLATSALVVIPGQATATVPGAIGRIVYLSDADQPASELYVRDFAGSAPVRITNDPSQEFDPKWSPDGNMIAFSRAPSKGVANVHTVGPDGSNEANLTSSWGGSNYVQDWSPDGKRLLLLSDRSGKVDLWVMYADGSDPRQLTNTSGDERDAAWSPDGSTIAFSRGSDIWLMGADGSDERNLTNRGESDHSPAWSPDGTKIAFTSSFNGNDNVWIMGADGSFPFSLTNTILSENYAPAWSPDGTKIGFTSNRDGDYDLWMMDADGTNVSHLTDHPAGETHVDWESVNRVPKAVDDEATTHRGQSVEIDPLGNDSDPDGEMLSLVDITRMPDEGSVAIDPSGTVTYTHNGATVPSNHVMPYTDSFEYKVNDSRLGSATGTVQVWIYPYFDDVPQSNVFFDDVLWLAVQRITQGCNPPDNTLFCPLEFVTRGQMAAFLVRARSYMAGGGDDLFVDDNGSVFELDIDKLGTAGVTRGCNPPINDRFCPDGLVTRGQMAAFLARAFNLTDLGMDDLFVDDNLSTFEADIDTLGATGVSKGCNPPINDRFCPDDYVTREQMAAFIGRAVSWGEE